MNSKCCNSKMIKDYLGNKRCSHCLLVSDDIKNFRMLYIMIILIILTTGFSIQTSDAKLSPSYCKQQQQIVDTCDIELNDSCILKELIKDSVILPGIALAQAKIESDHYRSEKCVKYHNLFGIKPHPCKYVKGEIFYQATYSSYKDCIKCYSHIQKYYLSAIDGHYAMNPNYVSLLKQVQ